MNAWSPTTLDHDVACDWLEDLYDSDPLAFFAHCLDLSDQPGRGLGHVACVGVVCTAEMISGLLFGPHDGLPEAARVWIERNAAFPAEAFRPKAVKGLRRVLEKDSEMYVRWEDQADQFPAWKASVNGLLARLDGQPD